MHDRRCPVLPVPLVLCAVLANCVGIGPSAAANSPPCAAVDEPIAGIVFVSGDICNPDPEQDGKHSTKYWREGYIYHRATTLDPIERTMTPTRPGRNLYTLVPAEPGGRLNRITHLTDGEVFDPEPSYDGGKILFSMRRDGEDWFHLCEINADGSNPVQLTDGPFNDVSGVYLPDGRIVFVSDRAGYLEEYHEERTETLWIANGDGTGIEQLTFAPGTVFDPTVLADGRIAYSYWDDFLLNVPPIDKHETYLMTIRPDGTEERHLFGVREYEFFNRERHSGFSVTQAGQMPDGTLLVLSEMGPSLLDLSRGMKVAEAMWPIFPCATAIQLGGATHRVHLSPIGSRTTPCPLPDGRFLYSATLPGARDLGLYVCDPTTRRTRLIFNDPRTSEYDPRPIFTPRPLPKMLPPKGRYTDASRSKSARRRRGRLSGMRGHSSKASGTPKGDADLVAVTGRARFVVFNPRRSDNAQHEKALRKARYFRVVEELYTAATASSHTNLATRILGVVPIPPDGPVYFEAPANTPLFLEALDAAGNRIFYDWNLPVTSVPIGSKQAMVEMSTFTARPGEVKSCHGCHAPEPEVVHSSLPTQVSGQPVRIERASSDILYRRNEPDEYRTAARIGEAPKYRPWLTHPDPESRRRACLMLMAIEDGARQDAPAIARLLARPASPDDAQVPTEPVTVRRAAALALTHLGSMDQVPVLLKSLEDPDWQVRFHAGCALEAITACAPEQVSDIPHGKLSLPPFPAPGDDARDRWFEAVGRMGTAAPETARRIVRQSLDVPLPPLCEFEASVGKQHYTLDGPAPPLAAIRAAGWIRDASAVPRLTPWLTRHDYNYHATEAALALGRIGTNGAIEALWQALRSEVPKRRIFNSRYVQHGPRPEEYALLRGLILSGAKATLEDVPLIIAMLPGTFLEKPRNEDRLRPESQRVLLGRLLMERAGLRRRAIELLAGVLAEDVGIQAVGEKRNLKADRDDPLYVQILKGINLERPFFEHGRPFPAVEHIEPEQALWLLGCLVDEKPRAGQSARDDEPHVPEELILPYLTSENWRERIDGAVLLNRLGVSRAGAELLASEIAKPYSFPEILSIGKSRPGTNYRDKCYMLVALARHTASVERLRPFADPRRNYRDIRYGLALGLGYRGTPDGIGLLSELATVDPIGVVRRQARESLRRIQETQRWAGKPVPQIDLPSPVAAESLYPPRRIDWPGPLVVASAASPGRRTLEALKQQVAQILSPEQYRNLNNTNNQAPGATRMMVGNAASLAGAVEALCAEHAKSAEPILREMLDSPYPFAHYVALRQLAGGDFPDMDEVLAAKLDAFAKSGDTVGFYWTCEALAARRMQAAVPQLVRYAQAETWPGLHGPIGMGCGYPAAKALARLVDNAARPETSRLLDDQNAWLSAGALAGLTDTKDRRLNDLLYRFREHHPSALVRAEAAAGLSR